MKKFLNKAEGFTLVELIVVIAILGILAGVAVPAYTGYINKAKEAGDTQIISAVNTAITAATAVNDAKVTDASYSGGTITLTWTDNVNNSGASTKAAADYALYIGDNDTTFEYYDGVAVNTDGLIYGTKSAG